MSRANKRAQLVAGVIMGKGYRTTSVAARSCP